MVALSFPDASTSNSTAYQLPNSAYLLPQYMLLALLVTICLLYTVNVQNAREAAPALKPLKVSLMTMSAPKPKPVQPPVQQPKKVQPFVQKKTPPKSVQTTTKAMKKVTKSQPLPKKAAQQKVATKKVETIAAPRPIKVSEPAPSTTKPLLEQVASQNATSVIHEARYRKQTPPHYPRRALELGQQGIVTLHAEILQDGRAKTLKIVRSSGHRLLDKAALAAVKRWEFEPTNINGNMITSWVRVPVHFVIQ